MACGAVTGSRDSLLCSGSIDSRSPKRWPLTVYRAAIGTTSVAPGSL
jgi:hypothetical protein